MLDGGSNVGMTVIEKGTMASTQIGAAASVFGFLSLNQWLAIGGFALAVLSFIFQVCCTIYFKSKHLQIAEERFKADLQGKSDPDDS